MTLLICGAVLFVAIAALFTFQVLNFRSSFQRDTATLAAIIANNSTAALVFNDANAGAEVVSSLQAKPTVVAACLVSPDGSLFAQFGNAEDAKKLSLFPPAGEFRFTGGHLLYTQPVELNRKQVGKLYLRLDYRQTFLKLLGFYGWVILGVMIVTTSLAVFLSGRLWRIITDPVLTLAETAQIVGEKNDYSVRARVYPRADELGRLTEAFNQMLSRIESQDLALKESRDAELNLSREKLRSLIHSIDGIVWECTPDAAFQFTFISRQVERILGYTPEQWLSHPGFWQEKLHPEDTAQAIQTCHDMVARRQPYNQEYRMLATDGRTVWIRESGVVLSENDRPTVVRGIFQDISKQKKAAEELEVLNRKLVETSRHAGMAEVATGVLHNVGNVLNSMNVSVTLMREHVQKSKAANLIKVVELFRKHQADLGAYITSDPQGKMIPGYLGQIAARLVEESHDALLVVELVTRSMNHIKQIVAMQQSYASVAGVPETLPAAALIEDALQINAAAMERHGIKVVRDYADVPPVTVDKHKVLQILINLVCNAKYALDKSDCKDKVLRLGLACNGDKRLKITVCDNGVGIAPENLIKIFNHGFTTKKDGHGFGLHSGANAAKEMGGRLTAHSGGPGKGAEFVLELPTTANARKEEIPAKRRKI